MLAFVTSLRAKALAADWGHHVRLLDRMLASCLAQSDPRCVVVVVYHDRPETQLRDPRLHFIHADLPIPERTFDDMTTDKGLKGTIGAEWAIREGCRFVMYADADDLVSRRLVEFVHRHPDGPGWYFPRGYRYRYGRRWVEVSLDHDLICGTCAIVRSDLLTFAPDAGFRGGRMDTFAAAGHTNYRRFMAAAGHPLTPLPFPGSVYIQHGDNTVSVLPRGPMPSLRLGARAVRQQLRRLRRLRPLTPALRREFTLDHSEP